MADYVAGGLHDHIITLLQDKLGKIQSKSNLHSNLDADEVVHMEDKTDKEIQRRKDNFEFIQLRVRQLDESLKRRSPHVGQQRLPATPPKDSRQGSDQAPVWDSTSPKGRSQYLMYTSTDPGSPPTPPPQLKKARMGNTGAPLSGRH
ncbi:hypothetical protein HETIRDRAFT_316406 [Heterobasidion irregulare TC 32-1]|uniref:Uncharacterized protein n=1 Tax=Heterobasidion irregulare (strain TC 32-1) TaxID=747525 RepID=W4KBP6_HETIT|nr:uncharacterized protein HETIRDRAFT_316406 [Heterobasidion irregulare TC 32-1]ETW82491.1 hypothetical protein HETIRDRAFT_316406 [Heterobasidion irregulare TC 32-1]